MGWSDVFGGDLLNLFFSRSPGDLTRNSCAHLVSLSSRMAQFSSLRFRRDDGRIVLSKGYEDERNKLLGIARAEIGVREKTGCNDGKRIEAYLNAVGLRKGSPYCAAFVCWVFKQTGYAEPRTGWSPALFPDRVLVKSVVAEQVSGLVFGLYFPSLKRIAHCGFAERLKGDWLNTIEGNTNLPGSREGDGVYRRMRHIRTIYRFADWTNTKQNRMSLKRH